MLNMDDENEEKCYGVSTDHQKIDGFIFYSITYLVDTSEFLCQHEKLHPLTARRRKYILEKIYRDIKKSFSMTHRNTSLQRVETIYQIRNRLMVILNKISFVAQTALNNCV